VWYNKYEEYDYEKNKSIFYKSIRAK
jgi:hypothetical protein